MRLPDKDVNEIRSGLTASEEVLDPTGKQLEAIAGGADVRPDEAALMRGSTEAILKLRVRREHAILGRIFVHVLSRAGEGGKLQPLSEGEAKVLLEIMGTLSHSEHDSLKHLRDKGAIDKPTWDKVIAPARDASNETQAGQARATKVKWGLATAGNQAGPMLAAIGIGTAVAGPIGAVGAMVLSLGLGMTITPKIQTKIMEGGRVEGRTLGMNVLEGEETTSEAMLLTARAAEGDILLGGKGTLLDRIKSEVELGSLAVKARGQAGVQPSPLEQPFFKSAAQYHGGLAKLAEKAGTGRMKEAELRQAVYDIRSQVLSPAFTDTVARTSILHSVVANQKTQALAFLRNLADIAPQLHELVKKNGGAADQPTQQTAGALLAISGALHKDNQGLVSDKLKAQLTTLAQGGKLDGAGVAELGKQAELVRKDLKRREPELKLSEGGAKEQAQAVFNVLWGQVVPSFQGQDETPKAKDLEAKPLPGGGFEVTGSFKAGLLWGSTGSFSVKLTDIGTVDTESLKVVVGEPYMKEAAKSALQRYGAMLGHGELEVDDVNVTQKGEAPDKPYEVACTLGTGKTAFMKISPMGMVDWGSIKIA